MEPLSLPPITLPAFIKHFKEYGLIKGSIILVGYFFYIVIFLSLLFLCVLYIGRYTSKPSVSPIQTPTILGIKSGDSSKVKKEVDEIFFSENQKENWDFSTYKNKWSTSEYCPKDRGNQFEMIWMKKSIPLENLKLHTRIRVLSNSTRQYETRLVLSARKDYGESNPDLFEFHIPINDGQTVNFKEKDGNAIKLSYLKKGKTLPSPIDGGSVLDITGSTIALFDTKATAVFSISYVKDGEKQQKDFSYDFDTNDPQPSNLKINLGVGTYVGSCITLEN